jgi:hypothetical protein
MPMPYKEFEAFKDMVAAMVDGIVDCLSIRFDSSTSLQDEENAVVQCPDGEPQEAPGKPQPSQAATWKRNTMKARHFVHGSLRVVVLMTAWKCKRASPRKSQGEVPRTRSLTPMFPFGAV